MSHVEEGIEESLWCMIELIIALAVVAPALSDFADSWHFFGESVCNFN